RDSATLHNKAVGGDGNTGTAPIGFIGTATGGGIDNSIPVIVAGGVSQPSKLTVINSIISGNKASGGDGNAGSGETVYLAAGLGGGVANLRGATLTVNTTTVANNLAIGGEGGDGLGGGIFQDGNSSSTLTLLGDTIDKNHAIGGEAGPSGSDGKGVGGGLYLTPGSVAC